VHWGLAGAFAAAIAYGVATILQTIGARRTQRAQSVDVRMLWRLVHSWMFIAGLGLDGLGFALSLAALRSLPLFVVQAAISASLAVTALLAAAFLRARLQAREWLAIALVSAGLAMLAISSARNRPAGVDLGGRTALLLGVGLLGAVAFLAGRATRTGPGPGSWALGVLAGLAYGASGIGARILHHPRSLLGLVTDPATWAMMAAGLLGILLYATAVQRGTVTRVTAAVVVTETLVPAAIGVALLHDHPRHGYVGLAAIGFVCTVAGAVALARHGEAPTNERLARGSATVRPPADVQQEVGG